MKIGIIGLPLSGKKTLFKLLTGSALPANPDGKPVPGVADIRDARFDYFVNLYKPAKSAHARISMELMPDLDKRIIQEGAIFKDIANLDALCFVARAFMDDSIYHVSGSVDPERDIEEILGELVLHDLLFIEKRMERLGKSAKKSGGPDPKKEEDLLNKFKSHLEKDMPLRTMEISEDEKKIILSYPFTTMKELIIVLNAGDNDINDNTLKDKLNAKYGGHKIEIMRICAKLEAEIEALPSEEERSEFMQASGIKEPAINLLSALCMDALGLISYFTVGKDEVKQWLVRKGALAPEAGGVIHSDIERGFIRAEVMKYNEFIEFGSEEKLKQAGKFYVMGRDYEVGDGDIMNFRFNV